MKEALRFAAAYLLNRPEPRKVSVVLSAGQPDDPNDTFEALAHIRQEAIEQIGVGIQHDISHLFPDALRVDGPSDLRRKLVRVVERVLLRA